MFADRNAEAIQVRHPALGARLGATLFELLIRKTGKPDGDAQS